MGLDVKTRGLPESRSVGPQCGSCYERDLKCVQASKGVICVQSKSKTSMEINPPSAHVHSGTTKKLLVASDVTRFSHCEA
jgi:hypothetical protein